MTQAGIANVLDFGATPNAVADSYAAFVAAQNASNSVLVPPGIYYLSSPVQIANGSVWQLQGAVIKPMGVGQVLFEASSDGWLISGNGVLEGSAPPNTYPTNTNEKGLVIDGGQFWRVDGLTVRNFTGWGVQVKGASYGSYRGETGCLNNLTLFGNLLGLEVMQDQQGAEYVTVNNITAVNNIHAIEIGAGNTIINGGNVVDNYNGVYIKPGVNDGHGIISAVNINHIENDAIKIADISNGFTFNGVHVYSDATGGNISINNSKGVRFSGSVISAPVINTGNAGANHIWNSLLVQPYFSLSGDGARLMSISACFGD